jgi:NADH:ubiquinone oxidoreductase subunit E
MQRSELRPLLQQKFPRDRTYLLPVLHFLQHEFGYLPDWALQIVSWHLRIPASEVYGVATSYSELRVRKPGKHTVRVCNGLSCWHNGGQQLLEYLTSRFGISSGETTPDGEVTLEGTPCGFLCPMAPAVDIDGRWQGRAVAQEVASQIEEWA